jgi:hypothetical protein
VLIPALLWAGPAQAFFCMSFGTSSKSRGFGGPPPIMAAAPAMFAPAPGWAAAPPEPPPAPVSDNRRPEPELVEWPMRKDGRLTQTQYRFRPVDKPRLPPIDPGKVDGRR